MGHISACVSIDYDILCAAIRILYGLWKHTRATHTSVQGGEIVTQVHDLTLHGSPFHRDCGQLLMPRVCVPLMTFISKWIHEGALDDPHGEFFVSACNHHNDTPSGQLPAGATPPNCHLSSTLWP